MCQSYENDQNKIINNYMNNVNKTRTFEILSICFISNISCYIEPRFPIAENTSLIFINGLDLLS